MNIKGIRNIIIINTRVIKIDKFSYFKSFLILLNTGKNTYVIITLARNMVSSGFSKR